MGIASGSDSSQNLKKRAVFVFFNPAMFRTALEISEGLKNGLGMECLLFSPTYLPQTEEYRSEASRKSLMFVCGMLPSFQPNNMALEIYEKYGIGNSEKAKSFGAFKPPHFTERWKNRILGAEPKDESLARKFIDSLSRSLLDSDGIYEWNPTREQNWMEALTQWTRLYLHQLKQADEFVDFFKPHLLICGEENIDYNSAVWIEAFQRKDIPTVCYSSAIPAATEQTEHFRNRPENELGNDEISHYIKTKHPEWVYRFPEKSILRTQRFQYIALHLLGLTPANPWIVNTGKSKRVLIESDYLREIYLGLGIETFLGRVKIVGHPAMDSLFRVNLKKEEIRAQLTEEFGFDNRKPIALFAFPTNQFLSHKIEHLSTYIELLVHWIEELFLLTNYNPLVTIHPSMPESDIEILRARRVPFKKVSAAELIPVCDLYVASLSTTIKWARALGKPVINYNCYRMPYNENEKPAYFDGFPHIHCAKNSEEFHNLLMRFNNPIERSQLVEGVCEGREYWGLIDGFATHRICKALEAEMQNARRFTDLFRWGIKNKESDSLINLI